MRSAHLRKALACMLSAALMCTMSFTVSAFFQGKTADGAAALPMSRSVVIGDTLQFSDTDFSGGGALSAITITHLPDSSCGFLCMGTQLLSEGAVIRASALSGLRFQTVPAAQASATGFSFLPTYTSGDKGEETEFELRLLTRPDQAPIAENLSISTYRNVSVTGRLQATDAEGGALVYQITSTPARGSVTLAEDGSGSFVYRPYENKTGKDSFTYVAADPAGNLSNPAKVTVRIEKQKSGVTYSDMDASGAHKAAVRLAEEGIFVGEHVGGQYFFHPGETISRGQFLAMAMAVAGLEPLEQVSVTGFADDASIPAWAKGHVSSALRAGAISGMRDADGQAVFRPEEPVTRAQAAAMLDHLLGISEVAVQSWSALGIEAAADSHWALPAVVNLSSAGIPGMETRDPGALDSLLTRADAAELLDGSLDVLAARKSGGWFLW